MLLVEDFMTREVITVTPETTAKEILSTSREKRVRHFPVIEDGRLVGLLSDRDLRSATPASGDAARAAALEEIKASSVMSPGPVTCHPKDPIEQAANTMREKKIGCLPVLEGEELVGILSSSDVMAALVFLVGANEPASRIEISLSDEPGALAGAADAFRACGVNIVSMAVGTKPEPDSGNDAGERGVVFRVETINPGRVASYLEDAGYRVLWPPKP